MYCSHCMEQIPDNSNICSKCNSIVNKSIPIHHLITMTVLNDRYLIGDAIGEGTWGITYIGFDLSLKKRVVIKEYFPKEYANRSNVSNNGVTIKSSRVNSDYFRGKQSFLKRAMILTKFSNNSCVVSVSDFFECNNTAYVVMEYFSGDNLKSYIKDNGSISSVVLVKLFEPLLIELGKLHKYGLVHGDINPENIIVFDNKLKLIDFGIGEESATDNKLLMSKKNGYVPIEFYITNAKQGPWTDIYEICATMYSCLTGAKPLDSYDRTREDKLLKPSQLGVNIPQYIENAIIKGLSVEPQDRQSDMEQLQTEIIEENVNKYDEETGEFVVDAHTYGNEKKVIDDKDNKNKNKKKFNKKVVVSIVALISLIAVVLLAVFLFTRRSKENNLQYSENDKHVSIDREGSEADFEQNSTLAMSEEKNTETIDNTYTETEKIKIGIRDGVLLYDVNGILVDSIELEKMYSSIDEVINSQKYYVYSIENCEQVAINGARATLSGGTERNEDGYYWAQFDFVSNKGEKISLLFRCDFPYEETYPRKYGILEGVLYNENGEEVKSSSEDTWPNLLLPIGVITPDDGSYDMSKAYLLADEKFYYSRQLVLAGPECFVEIIE